MAVSHSTTGYNPVVSAKQLADNKKTAWIYAATFSGLISIFILAHFTRTLFQLSGSRRRSKVGWISRAIVAPFRLYRRAFLRKLPKVSSGGHLLLIIVYFGCNVALTVYDEDFKFPYSHLAKRCGWMAITNSCFAFLLAMKNNPLAFLTGYSHERLNVLHRWVGRTIFVYSLLHVYIYVASYAIRGDMGKVIELQSIYGWVALVAFKIIYATSLQFIRKRFYEFFYMVHVVMFLLSVIFMALHKPHKFAPVMYAVGAFWCIDRLIRTIRMIIHSRNNTATLIPLSGLATKVVFSKPIWSQPGSHAFISIPKIRKFQSHPFTISSSNNVEFVIKAQKGFTLDLHKYALKHPGTKVKAHFDGPYGAVPDFGRFNRVVLFAGGSGGGFTFPIAMDLVKNMGRFCTVAVEFVWVIRDERHITWYESEIETLQKTPNVNVSIYVTTQTDPIVTSQPVEVEAAAERDVRNSLYIEDDRLDIADLEGRLHSTSSDSTLPSPSSDEKHVNTLDGLKGVDLGVLKEIGGSNGESNNHLRAPSTTRPEIRRNRNSVILESQIDQRPRIKVNTLGGRPDIGAIVKNVVSAAEERDLVAVAACGPVELMRVARNAVADSIQIGGASVTLHCEQFGWG